MSWTDPHSRRAMTMIGSRPVLAACCLGAIAACWALGSASTTGWSVASSASAQSGPYISDIPKLFPRAYANWKKALPYAIKPGDWLLKLKGVTSPIRDVSVSGAPMKFGTICVPHDCGDNIAGILFTPQQDRIVALVQLNSESRTPVFMMIGKMSSLEMACLQPLLGDVEDKLSAC